MKMAVIEGFVTTMTELLEILAPGELGSNKSFVVLIRNRRTGEIYTKVYFGQRVDGHSGEIKHVDPDVFTRALTEGLIRTRSDDDNVGSLMEFYITSLGKGVHRGLSQAADKMTSVLSTETEARASDILLLFEKPLEAEVAQDILNYLVGKGRALMREQNGEKFYRRARQKVAA